MPKPSPLKLRIGTRESALAMAQTELVLEKLKELHPTYEWEIVSMKTKGDEILNKTLSKIGMYSTLLSMVLEYRRRENRA